MFSEFACRLGRVGDTCQRRRFDLVEQREPAALHPADGRGAVRLRPAVERPASVECHRNVVRIGPVEETIVFGRQCVRQERAGQKRVAAAQLLAVEHRPDFLEGEERQMSARGEEGALAVRMGDADGERGADAFDRPGHGPLGKGLPQPGAELVVADIGCDCVVDAERIPGERAVAGAAADAQLVMVDDDFGSGFRPGGRRPEDEVDIGVADHGKRTHRYSLRVILVERTGVPAFSTRAAARRS